MNDDFSSIDSDSDWRFVEVAALFESAFPPSERKPLAFLSEVLSRGDYTLLAQSEGQDLVGFSILFTSTSGFSLLEYMAVSEAKRGEGRGSDLFQRTATFRPQPLLLEVEDPDPDLGGSPLDRARRIRFYSRLGCRLVPDIAYVMPQVSQQEPPPMRLMIANYLEPALPTALLSRWVSDIYAQVYGRPPDDPALARMFAPLPVVLVL
jgi:hypothetical protein